MADANVQRAGRGTPEAGAHRVAEHSPTARPVASAPGFLRMPDTVCRGEGVPIAASERRQTLSTVC